MCGACKRFFYRKNEFFLIKSEFFSRKFLILALINEFKYNYNTHFLFKKWVFFYFAHSKWVDGMFSFLKTKVTTLQKYGHYGVAKNVP